MNKVVRSSDTPKPERIGMARWLEVVDENWSGGGYWKCNKCGYGYAFGAYFEMDESNYCPHCGARMDGKEQEK